MFITRDVTCQFSTNQRSARKGRGKESSKESNSLLIATFRDDGEARSTILIRRLENFLETRRKSLGMNLGATRISLQAVTIVKKVLLYL